MPAKTAEGVAELFTLLGLAVPSQARLDRIAADDRSYGQVRDALISAVSRAEGVSEEEFLQDVVQLWFTESDVGIATGGETEEERLARIAGELRTGDRTFREVRETIRSFSPTEVAPTPDQGGIIDADPATLPGVLAGGTTIKVSTEVGDRFYQVYEWPQGSGQFISYQFNDLQQVRDTFGPSPAVAARPETWFDQNVIAEATAEEVIGQPGSFQRLTQELMQDAAVDAGLRDPTLIGQLASDPEMQQVMASAIAGDWTPEQVTAAQRNTTFWKETLYPGIEAFYDRTSNPEQAWNSYVQNVSPALRQLGYSADPDGTFNSQIKRMLDQNIDDQTFLSQTPTFIKATQNAEFAGVLNQWAERTLGREVTFNDWFDLLAGESIPELEQIAEQAQLAHQAQTAGVGIDPTQIEQLAATTQLSEAEAGRAFSEFNQAVLALGEQGLKRGGLSRDEILSSAAGVAPESGRSIEEVRRQIGKVVKEAALFDDEKIQFFVGFTPQGTPERPGLKSLRPEGA